MAFLRRLLDARQLLDAALLINQPGGDFFA